MMACCCHIFCKKTLEEGDSSCHRFLCSKTLEKRKGNDSKLDVMAFFVATTIEEKKSDNNKLATITHFFSLSKKKKKSVMIASLLLSPYSE
jgi:hypothetical protein